MFILQLQTCGKHLYKKKRFMIVEGKNTLDYLI